MQFSLAWLRALCPFDADADLVSRALTARGLTVDATLPAGADQVLDVDVPANRPDCLGHLGLARELSAAFGVPLGGQPDAHSGADDRAPLAIEVRIDSPQLCSRYTAQVVRGVRVGPSPPWVVARLEACGVRSLNNVVDVSNLVMLELGNPIHFFDLDRLPDRRIRVRRATHGETLTTLDGVKRQLDPEMLVIADSNRPVALAGVMGGADTEIGLSTRDVLIEAAWFEPVSIRSTSRRLGLKTDASHRFERGVDIEAVVRAQQLACRLLSELCAGSCDSGLVDVFPRRPRPRTLVLRHSELSRILGYQPAAAAVLESLAALQLEPAERDGARIEVRAPSWRSDLEREADLIEEVARHLGYDAIPTRLDGLPVETSAASEIPLDERVRDLLASAGLSEAYGYAMIGPGEDEDFVAAGMPAALSLTNPIAENLAVLRRSLLPGLLQAVELNHRRGRRDVRLFEVGRVFRSGTPGEFPQEMRHAAVAWSGAGRPRHWSDADREVDLVDIFGVVDFLLGALRPGVRVERRSGGVPGLHPGRSAVWVANDLTIAWAGALHPRLQPAHPHPLYLAELDLELVEAIPRQAPQYQALPRLTEVARDLSLRLPRRVTFREIRAALAAVEPPARSRFSLLDRYEGAPLAEDEVSLTVRIVLSPDERTLTDGEIEGYRQELIASLKSRLDVSVRGE